METFLYTLIIIVYVFGGVIAGLLYLPTFKPIGRIDCLVIDFLALMVVFILIAIWPIQVVLSLLQRLYEVITNGKETIF